MAQLSPAQTVLARHFEEYARDVYPGESEDDVFEKYVASLILRPRNLDEEELQSGLVDGQNDGGIDGFYTFLNGSLVQSDHPDLEPESSKSRRTGEMPSIEVVILQSKNKSSWADTSLERLLSNLPILLDTTSSEELLAQSFRQALVEQVSIYRELSTNLSTQFPKLSFRIYNITRAPEANLSAQMATKTGQVVDVVKSMLTPGAEVFLTNGGAESLYRLAGDTHAEPATLRMQNNVIREASSYIGIATLENYLSFARSPNGELREELFESNVRDYEGANAVNQAIQKTLATANDAMFWWQNNGVTILGRRVQAPAQDLVIDQPLIVNGLQTTHVIHQAERSQQIEKSRLSEGILIRVIESDIDEVRDQVIAGTNRQTRVDGPSLFATEQLQIDLERYFLAHDWYYERRKNRYRNLGKSAARRVSITLLGQAMMSLTLGEPDAARARPSTVLNKSYEKVFDDKVGQPAYLTAAQVISAASAFLRTSKAREIINDYSNVRFYFAVAVAMRSLGTTEFSQLKFAHNHHKISGRMKDQLLASSLERTAELFSEYSDRNPGSTRDAVAKSSDFRKFFLGRIGS